MLRLPLLLPVTTFICQASISISSPASRVAPCSIRQTARLTSTTSTRTGKKFRPSRPWPPKSLPRRRNSSRVEKGPIFSEVPSGSEGSMSPLKPMGVAVSSRKDPGFLSPRYIAMKWIPRCRSGLQKKPFANCRPFQAISRGSSPMGDDMRTKLALYLLIVTPLLAAAQADDPNKKLDVFLGHWETQATSSDTSLSKAGKITSSVDCRRSPQGGFLICEQQIIRDGAKSVQIAIYSYNAK